MCNAFFPSQGATTTLPSACAIEAPGFILEALVFLQKALKQMPQKVDSCLQEGKKAHHCEVKEIWT